MKKMFKKMGTFVLTFVLMLSMATNVFAATQGTITLHTGKHNVNGMTFNVYKMMSATVTADEGSAAYKIANDFNGFFTTNVGQDVTDDQAYIYINDNVKTSDFQNKVKAYVTEQQLSPAATLTGTDAKSYTTSTLDAGYYVIIPSDNDAGFTPMFTTVAKVNQDIYLKGVTPGVDKTVEGEQWTSAQVGDTIRFKVESMVPNMTGYTEYHFQLTDTMSVGLTVTKETLNEKVIIGDQELKRDTHYLVEVVGQVITIKINDFINYNNKANEVISFEYEAVLNKTAFTEDKETNTAKVEYGNTPGQFSETDTLIVRTHNLTINKTNEDGTEKLAGAQFKLYRGKGTATDPIKFVHLVNGEYRVATANDSTTTDTLVSPGGDEGVKGIIKIHGLDVGEYTLVETIAPNGYNKLKDPENITITADSSDEGNTVDGQETSVDVQNKKGLLLPETGGMGTVVFTVVGVVGILAVAYSFMPKKSKDK